MEEILNTMDLMAVSEFTTIHNYIDTKAMILRKGADSFQYSFPFPRQIRLPSRILIGIINCSPNFADIAPHGAGRLMSRAKAKEAYSVDEFQKQMDGIYTTSVGRDTLDECPMAYKRMEDIVGNIADTVHIEKIIKPIYNFKAGGE